MALQVGDVILVGKAAQERGTVKFIGDTEFQAGEWVGVELEKPSGKNDGSVQGKKYFECKPNHGIFVRANAVAKAPDQPAAKAAAKATAPKRASTAPKRPSVSGAPGSEDAKPPSKARASTLSKADGDALASPKPRASTTPKAELESPRDAKPPPKARASTASKVETPRASAPPPKDAAAKASGTTPPAKAAAPKRSSVSSARQASPRSSLAPLPQAAEVDAAVTPPVSPAVSKDLSPPKRSSVSSKATSPKPEAKATSPKPEAKAKAPAEAKAPAKAPAKASFEVPATAPAEEKPKSPSAQAFKRGKSTTFHEEVEERPIEAVPLTAEALKDQERKRMMRKMSMSSRRDSMASNMSEVIVCDDNQQMVIMGEDGEELDIQDLIEAFEEARQEMEGLQELLQRANDREKELRKELAAAQSSKEAPVTNGSVASPAASPAPVPPPTVSIAGGDIYDNVLMLTDSHKVAGHLQYPPGCETVYSYFECAGGPDKEIVFFGLQYYIKRYLAGPVVTRDRIDTAEQAFKAHFCQARGGFDPSLFNKKGWEYILKEYGGHLPILIKAVPEGTVLPRQQVMFTVENTDDQCFWLTGYLEALLMQVWYPTAVCTVGREAKKTIAYYLNETGSSDAVSGGDVDLKLHDFGFRGAASVESAGLAGCAHLVHFSGTDTLAALVSAKAYYGEESAGRSNPSSETGTVISWGQDQEVDAMRQLLNAHPKGALGCASGSHDALNACENYLGGALKDLVEKRDGRLIVRAGAGEPVAAVLQVLEKLEGKFGSTTTSTGHRLLPDYLRVQQSEGVDSKTMVEILEAMKRNSWAADNVCFGGGGSLQKAQYDALKCAMKCSYVKICGHSRDVSWGHHGGQNGFVNGAAKTGRLALIKEQGTWKTVSGANVDPSSDKLVAVFRNGRIMVESSLADVRNRSQGKEVSLKAAQKPTARAPGPPPRLQARQGEKRSAQEAASNLRLKMGEMKHKAMQLKEQAENLRTRQKIEDPTAVLEQDKSLIEHFAKIYTMNLGLPARLAEACQISADLLDKKPPRDAEDFARNLLEGCYSGENAEIAKQNLRERLREDLKAKAQSLNKVHTKRTDGVAGASAADIQAISKIYDEHGGDLETIAGLTGAHIELMRKKPPQDGAEFAKNLLEGVYTGDTSAMAKQALRDRLEQDLQERAKNLRKAKMVERAEGPSEADVQMVARIYIENEGDLEKIAQLTGAHINLIRKRPPKDPSDFARTLLEGHYTGDESELAKSGLRDRLLKDLQEKSKNLRKAEVKESVVGPAQADIECIARIFQDHEGDLDVLAELCGVSAQLMHRHPPEDAEDFARRLLDGAYSGDAGELAKKDMRARLLEGLEEQSQKLKKTKIRKARGGPSTADLDIFERLYNEHSGDLDRIAQAVGASAELLRRSPPANSADFARKLLDGAYSVGCEGELAKANLRDRLLEDLQAKAGNLRHTETKEGSGGPTKEDLDNVAKFYADCGGDPDKLAAACGCSAALLRRKPPADGAEFARKLFDGVYSGEDSDIAKGQFRAQLLESLQEQASKLKKIEVKELSCPEPTDQEIESVANIYHMCAGDLEQIAHDYHLNLEALTGNYRPYDAKDFARNLLNGQYTGDDDAVALSNLRQRLQQDLVDQASKLKHVERRPSAVGPVGPAASDIEAMARFYSDYDGDLDRIAGICGADRKLMERNPPRDADDFARKLLGGAYNGDGDGGDTSGVNVRDEFLKNIKANAVQLKRTVGVKESTGEAKAADIEVVAKIYTDNGGDFAKIAQVCGASVELMNKKPPTDANDFAKSLLEGLYTGDVSEIAKMNLRARLVAGDLQEKALNLNHVETKQSSYSASAADIEVVGKIWTDNGGDVDKVAQMCGASAQLLRASPPTDAADFARNLLEGKYTGDSSEIAKKNLRTQLLQDLGSGAANLKKVGTKQSDGGASAADIEVIAQIFKDANGEFDQLVSLTGCDMQLLQKFPPGSAQEFAKNLLEGVYSGDSADIARSNFRDQLFDDIKYKSKRLRKTSVKEAPSGPSQKDLQAFSKIYLECNGDLQVISEKYSLDIDLLQQNPPEDELEFASNLLEGVYTGETDERAKSALRARLEEDLLEQATKLRKVDVKEGSYEPSSGDLDCVALLYTNAEGDLAKLAEATGSSVEIMRSKPPADAVDFARKLLNGDYSGCSTDIARQNFRKQLLEGIQAPKLRKVEMQEQSTGPSEQDIEAIARVYLEHKGNADSLAQAFGANVWLIRKNPPSHAKEFAKKLLEGVYTGDKTDLAKVNLRDRLLQDLQEKASTLSPTKANMKVGAMTPTDEEIECIARLWRKHGGDLAKVAEVTGATLGLLQQKPPADGKDFARRLLDGAYTGDATEIAKASFRDRLMEDLLAGATRLKPVERRSQAFLAVKAPDVEKMAEIYTSLDGDLSKIAEAVGVSLQWLEHPKHKPKDAADFGQKLLEGFYGGDMNALTRQHLRNQLAQDIQAKAGQLRKVEVKEHGKLKYEPDAADVAALAKIYTDLDGDLERLVETFGIDIELLQHQSKAPTDAEDFARKMLEGEYWGVGNEHHKMAFRENLKDELQKKASQLRKVEVKEATLIDSRQEDVDCLARFYVENDGDTPEGLPRLAALTGASADLLRKNPPSSPEDFAKKLLQGAYAGEGEQAAGVGLGNFLSELKGHRKSLKKTQRKSRDFGDDGPAEKDVEAFANLYAECGGDTEKLVARTGIKAELLDKSPPLDGSDFAKKLLQGLYTGDDSDIAKSNLRDRLQAELLAQASKLKKVEVKEASASPSDADLDAIAKLYTEHEGDPDKLAEAFHAAADLIRKKPPSDARDFARNLFDGKYHGESTDVARDALRAALKEDINAQIKRLKHSEVKEPSAVAAPLEADVAALARLYAESGGDLDGLAERTGISPAQLKRSPPQSGEDFARKLLSGHYATS